MAWLGLIHAIVMAAALAIGAGLFAIAKGTARRCRCGRGFVIAVLGSNLLVLSIYEDSETMGIFHILAIVSFGSVLTALLLVRRGKGGPGTRIAHGHVMLWSFGGMVAAGLGQSATYLGQTPWPAIVAVFLCVGILAAQLDFKAMLRAG